MVDAAWVRQQPIPTPSSPTTAASLSQARADIHRGRPMVRTPLMPRTAPIVLTTRTANGRVGDSMPHSKKRATGRPARKAKKKIKNFLLSEEGKVRKKDLAKLGISLVALSSLAQDASSEKLPMEQTESGGCGGCGCGSVGHSSAPGAHANYFFMDQQAPNVGAGGHMSGPAHASHGSHAQHTSHSSHGSHGQW